MMSFYLVALDKSPGVFPVGIGDIIRHLLDKCVLMVIGNMATEVYGNLNLWYKLGSGIEGAVNDNLE